MSFTALKLGKSRGIQHILSPADSVCVRDGPDGAEHPEAPGRVRRGRGRRDESALRSSSLLRRTARRILRHQGEVHKAHSRQDGRRHKVYHQNMRGYLN